MWLVFTPFVIWGKSALGAAVVFAVGAIADSALAAALIGGVFLVLNSLITIWLTDRLNRRHDDPRRSRAHRARSGGSRRGRRRGTDHQPDDPEQSRE